MADQGKWFKLWESALDDQELENLSVHHWFCWARLGTYLKKHGKDGELTIKAPAMALQNLLRIPSFDVVQSVIKLLPGYSLEEIKSVTANVTDKNVTVKIKCSNWSKYQGDFSGERVRRYRARVTANVTRQEEKRRDVEEKRREVPPNPHLPSANSTAKANAEAAKKLLASTRGHAPTPGAYDIPEEDIMGGDEFARIKAAIKAGQSVITAAKGADDDVF